MKKLTDTITFQHGACVKNRMVMAPMQTHSGAKGGYVTEDTLQYYASRSEAAGLLITEFHYVSKNGGRSNVAGCPEQLGAYSDAHLEGLTALSKAMKQSGNKAILQIHHAGRLANIRFLDGKDVVAPSDMKDYYKYSVRALTEVEIEDIIKDFGMATRRAINAGVDGVEIHGANHYLLQQFFSVLTNQREDAWGGSFEKRMTFPLAVVREVNRVVREEAPQDFIVGCTG